MKYRATSARLLDQQKNSREVGLREQLDWFRQYRSKENVCQKEAYKGLLRFLHYRSKYKATVNQKCFISQEELNLFNIAKVLLDGGWVFE